MANKVEFKNTSGQTLFMEFGKQNNLTDVNPEVFDNGFDGHAKLSMVDFYGMLYPKADTAKKPFFYFRHVEIMKNRFRFGNLVELGDDYLSPQKGIYHAEDIVPQTASVSSYRKTSENPLEYGFECEGDTFSCRFRENETEIKEGNFLEIKAVPWPFTLYDHQSVFSNASTFFQPSTFIGSYEGEPVLGLGSVDRMCLKPYVNGWDDVPLGYISMSAMGIREDGRREYVYLGVALNSVGKAHAVYYLDGEVPIVTDCVTVEADWVHLPYVEDGTCLFKDSVFYFCGKKIHFEGKWGTKGFQEKPRIEKHGQSQVFGTWYEGDVPYKHRINYTLVENMEAYDYKLKELGFNVVE